jgi:hypothetical protein
MENLLIRTVDHMIGRITGPLRFRLIVQPCVAAFIAVRAGLRDAKQGRPAFLWSALFEPGQHHILAREGWRDIGKVFVVAFVLDSIYELFVLRWLYPLQSLIVAFTLAILPYLFLRGPVSRIARHYSTNKDLK